MNFVIREWLLLSSITGFILTSLLLGKIPSYSSLDFQIIWFLFIFFIIIKGLENSGLLQKIAIQIEKGRYLPLKLILTSFFCSMLITNDITLLLLVPLTLKLEFSFQELIVILEALAANAGSALTPIGNPQNLFLFWYYHLNLKQFIKVIAPFSLSFLFIFILLCFFFPYKSSSKKINWQSFLFKKTKSYFYLFFLFIFILSAIHILPIYLGIAIFIYTLFWDKKSLKVDYSLLLTFFFLFGFTENLKNLFLPTFEHPQHVFLLAAILSQFISNVPATLLLAKITSQWSALLWGVSVGGFGNLLGSLANLIAYRLVVTRSKNYSPLKFLLLFSIIGYIAFFIGIMLFYLLYKG